MRGTKWTDEEELELEFWYGQPDITVREISYKIGKTFAAITCKASLMGLHHSDVVISQFERYKNVRRRKHGRKKV